MSKIIGEGFTCFPKTSSENKTYTKYSLKLHCYVAFNTELHSRKINVPEHQQESCSDPFTVLHTSPSFPLTVFTQFLNVRFHCKSC